MLPSPSDPAVRMLCRSVPPDFRGPMLLLVDEAATPGDYLPLVRRPECDTVSNRLDMTALGPRVRFEDLTLGGIPQSQYAVILFRVSKAKAAVHHVINRARELLAPGGTLTLAGETSEGIKTYAARAGEQLGSAPEVVEAKAGARCVRILRGGPVEIASLPSDDYPTLRLVEQEGCSFYSKPGIFGWSRIDEGSRLLMDTIPTVPGSRVLDLGCGYGYLALRSAAAGAGEVTATDNCAAALAACRENFRHFGIAGSVIASSCGAGLEERYDSVICNPPFHEGFGTSLDLSTRFVAAMARLTRADGVSYLVSNSFLAYERIAAAYFRKVTRLTAGTRFKVLRLEGPADTRT